MPLLPIPFSPSRENSGYSNAVRQPDAKVQGVQQRLVSHELNLVDRTWNVQANVVDRDILHDFLADADGDRFLFVGDVYTCNKWQWKWFGSTGLWEFSATFERVNLP